MQAEKLDKRWKQMLAHGARQVDLEMEKLRKHLCWAHAVKYRVVIIAEL